jgi:hypothetical protein
MRIELLDRDLAELEELGLTAAEALRRGKAALGARPTYTRLRHLRAGEEALAELIHFAAEQAADFRLLRYASVAQAPAFAGSRRRHERVERETAELRLRVVPRLQAELRALRREEERLEAVLRGRGLDPDRIGRKVPPEEAIDLASLPGEGALAAAALPELPPRRARLARLRARFRRRP